MSVVKTEHQKSDQENAVTKAAMDVADKIAEQCGLFNVYAPQNVKYFPLLHSSPVQRIMQLPQMQALMNKFADAMLLRHELPEQFKKYAHQPLIMLEISDGKHFYLMQLTSEKKQEPLGFNCVTGHNGFIDKDGNFSEKMAEGSRPETCLEAAIRELKEETGIDLKALLKGAQPGSLSTVLEGKGAFNYTAYVDMAELKKGGVLRQYLVHAYGESFTLHLDKLEAIVGHAIEIVPDTEEHEKTADGTARVIKLREDQLMRLQRLIPPDYDFFRMHHENALQRFIRTHGRKEGP